MTYKELLCYAVKLDTTHHQVRVARVDQVEILAILGRGELHIGYTAISSIRCHIKVGITHRAGCHQSRCSGDSIDTIKVVSRYWL